MDPKKVFFYTFGCRVNQYESDAMADLLEKEGFSIVNASATPDYIIINTCTVTAESDRKCGQIIRRYGKKFPMASIIIAGCYAQKKPRELLELPGVKAVLGNSKKNELISILQQLETTGDTSLSILDNDIAQAPYDDLTLTKPRRCRSYIKIEDGCENRCAYCIIPSVRGKIRSKDEAMILKEISCLAMQGCEEVILTGIETASYGKDTNTSLADLLKKVNEIPGIKRIGLGSLEPNLLRSSFLDEVVNLPKLLPHFHLSMQSGSSGVLRRMRRPYNAIQGMNAIKKIRSLLPEAQITADIITGFPGETEEEFEETLSFCKEARFLHIHIFPYSNRKGTEADSMNNQVPPEIRHRRAEKLEEEQKKTKTSILEEYTQAHKTSPVYVLVEEPMDGHFFGHSEHYVDILLDCDSSDVLKIIPVVLDGHDDEKSFGHKVEA